MSDVEITTEQNNSSAGVQNNDCIYVQPLIHLPTKTGRFLQKPTKLVQSSFVGSPKTDWLNLIFSKK
jgi:hypothetical protein